MLLKGLAPEQAANLTAFMCGIPVGNLHWSLRQVNQLLFLRERASHPAHSFARWGVHRRSLGMRGERGETAKDRAGDAAD